LRVLVITNLFPNSQAPRVASFNRQQFAALGEQCEVEVLATLPWYPGQRLLGRFASHSVALNVPTSEEIDGLQVHHPKTLHIPLVGKAIAAPLFAASLLPLVPRYRSKVDVVLGSWAHPDGCAAVVMAGLLGVPAVVKVHGTDINHVATLPGPRRMMRRLLPRAGGIVAVSSALARGVEALGVDPGRVHLVMNGVDTSKFHPSDRGEARAALGLPQDGTIALYIGNLLETKGVHDLSAAFASIRTQAPDLHLYVVGEGKARPALEGEVTAQMTLVGSQPFEKIPLWLAACDFLVLPSWNEGTPNVVLEALACGRRVVATNVGGIPDLLVNDALGTMVAVQDRKALAQALLDASLVDYDPAEVAEQGARGDWKQSASDLKAVLARVLESSSRA
jgi:glycosyltransferase involved in cell wall biosynthesis